MGNNIYKKLNIHTKIVPNQRAKILRWLARQNEEMILYAFEKQKNHLFLLNTGSEKNRSILYLSAFYLAIDELFSANKLSKTKNKERILEKVKDITAIQAKSLRHSGESPKIEKLLNLKSKILSLKNEQKMSYRDISKFLKKFHRIDVSHTTIHTFFTTVLENKS